MALSELHQNNLRTLISIYWKQAEDQTGPLARRYAAELENNKKAVEVLDDSNKLGKPTAEQKKQLAVDRTIKLSLSQAQEEYVQMVERTEETGQVPMPQFGGQLADRVMSEAMSTVQSHVKRIPFVGDLLGLFGLDKMLPMLIKLVTVGISYFTQKTPPGTKGKEFGELWAEHGQREALKAVLTQNFPGINVNQAVDMVMSDKPLSGGSSVAMGTGRPPVGSNPLPAGPLRSVTGAGLRVGS